MAANNNKLMWLAGAALAYFLLKPKTGAGPGVYVPGSGGGTVDVPPGVDLVKNSKGQWEWNPSTKQTLVPGGGPGGGGMPFDNNGGGAFPIDPVPLDLTFTQNGQILQTELTPGSDFSQGNLSGVY